MKRFLFGLVVLSVLAGCGDDFLNEEMLLGDENKLRPLAVVCEPAEVSPGQEITVTLYYWDPDPDETSIDWRVALDYDSGLYGADPVERGYVDLGQVTAIDPPVNTGEGFMRQSVSYVVPTTVLRETSAIPTALDEEPWSSLTELVSPGEDLTQSDMDDFLSSLTVGDLASLNAQERALVLDLADIFACQIRFRIQLRQERILDVTRNVTVRHSRRLGSPNVNENTRLTQWDLVAVPVADVGYDQIDDYSDQLLRFDLIDGAGDPVPVSVPAHADWTYFIETDFAAQSYTSPFSDDRVFDEHADHRWYTFRRDDGDVGYPLLRNEDGEEAEMWELDDWVRIVPPNSGESIFRIYSCVRDDRPEWEGFHASSGTALTATEITFVDE